jgi:ApaG protein
MDVSTAILSLVASLLAGILLDEFLQWLAELSRRCIDAAVERLPAEFREEMREEFYAELQSRPGNLQGFLWSIDLMRGADVIAREFVSEEAVAIKRKNSDERSLLDSIVDKAASAAQRRPDELAYAFASNIEISVVPYFIEKTTNPRPCYNYGYHIKIRNHGKSPVQLIRRRWQIIDGIGRNTEVAGEGVLGKKPLIAPGASFEYSSRTPLSTPSAIMIGGYQMTTEAGGLFDVEIPPFSLDPPGDRGPLN